MAPIVNEGGAATSVAIEEKKALADYMKKSDPSYAKILGDLEKAK